MRHSLTLATCLLLAPAVASALTPQELTAMVQARVPDAVIVQQIQSQADGEPESVEGEFSSPFDDELDTPAFLRRAQD